MNEYGDPVVIRRRFHHHPDCVNAFLNLFCWINFPRCDMGRDESLRMCRSSCENYFISCKIGKDIWRCGYPQFFDHYKPEVPQKINGQFVYMRDYYPGSPWRDNKFNKENIPLQICTPAIFGSANTVPLFYSVSLIFVSIVFHMFYLFF